MRQKGIVHLFLLVVVVIVAVGAIGYLAYQNAQLKKQTSETTTTPETAEQQTEPTGFLEITGWKTYINNELGFSIEYPQNTYVIYEGFVEEMPGTSQSRLWQLIISNNENKDAKRDYSFEVQIDLVPILKGKPFSKNDIYSIREQNRKDVSYTTISGYDAVRYGKYFTRTDGTTGPSVQYYVFDGEKLVLLTGVSWSGNNINMDQIDQILSTFKFIE